RLIEQDDIPECSTKQQACRPAPNPHRNQRPEYTNGEEVQMQADSRPGLDPIESWIGKQESRSQIQLFDPAIRKVSPCLPDDEQAEGDTEDAERRRIDVRGKLLPQGRAFAHYATPCATTPVRNGIGRNST